jgi:Zn-finger nucleic acid-binding protein
MAQVDVFEVLLCHPCSGALMYHPDLTAILETSWRGIQPEVAEAKTFLASPQALPDPSLQCPFCRRAMEKYGYLGLSAVTIDRCDACNRIWLDADELQNMLLALAKTNYRSAARLKLAESSLLAGGLATEETVVEGSTEGLGDTAFVTLLHLLRR